MAAAARRLDRTRAQVSKQIGELERRLGVRLFERSTRKIDLTPSGEVFYQHARWRTPRNHRRRRSRRAQPRRGAAAACCASAPPWPSAACVRGAADTARVLARHPELECELILGDQAVDLADDRIDLALRMTRILQDVVARQLIAVQRVIGRLARLPGAPTANRARRWKLDGPPVLQLPAHRRWRLGASRIATAEADVRVRSRFQFNDIACLYDAVRGGHGLAILPMGMCGADLANGTLTRVLGDFDPARQASGATSTPAIRRAACARPRSRSSSRNWNAC
jgi:DNA-binding transcriptional LysR family regulator